MKEHAMGRLDAFRHIADDTALAEEILTRIAEEPDLAEQLMAKAAQAPSVHVLESLSRGPRVSADEARALIEAPPPRPTDPVLEAIVLLLGRPVLLIRDDDVDVTALEVDNWKKRLERARAVLRSAIPSVGRIELDRHPQLDWGGTGWVVADDVVVTNRHVAELFARRTQETFTFRPAPQGLMGARVDFREEHEAADPAEFRIAEVLHIEDDTGPDMAFLRIDWSSGAVVDGRPPIRLAGAGTPGREVAVIGYPAKDSRTRIPDDMDRIFGNIYNVKRLAPGELTGGPGRHDTVTHDCTTLGGNSGSVVLDLETGEALALHFAGREQDRNFAVPAAMVRDRLDRLRSSTPVSGDPLGDHTPRPTLEQMAGRGGYQPDFLGPTVDHPRLSSQLEDAVAPVAARDDGVLDYVHYSVRMHRFRRLAMYVAVNIDGASARNVRRGRDRWSLDPRLAPEFQAGNELYHRNKLDRGHLVRRLDPAWGDSFDHAQAGSDDTFFYTNCAPQHQTHNQQLWLGLEDHILGNAKVHDLRASVFSGPIFRDSDRRYREFLVPEDYWKVVAIVDDETGELSVTGYIVSQRDFMNDLEFAFGPFQTYQVPIAAIEEQTDLDFGVLRRFDPLATIETGAIRPLGTLDDIVL
jgi:endonuclease G